MNLRELEYLVAIDEERHFHRAAERCFVSQPTLSGQLKKLEQELGLLLVERNNRQVSMTDAGLDVAEQARRILGEVRALRDLAQSYQDPMTGEVQLGLIPTVAPYLLPVIMPVLNKQFPKLKFWLHEYQTHVLLEKLLRAELDLLILALPVDTNEFEELDLFREPFQLAVPKSNPMAKADAINMGDLSQQEVLLLKEGHCLRGQALDVCLLAGAIENASFRASSLETLRHMVGEGMGMTLIPELAVPKKKTKSDSTQYVPFSDPKPNRRIGMLYRKGSYRNECFLQMAEVIKTSLPVGIFF